MRKKWTMEQILLGQNNRAKQAGTRHDLTMEQWLETLEYFDHKCAYCGGEYQVIEHYLPIYKAGTTVSNCVPACLYCNIMKDKQGHDLSFYQNEYVILYCEGCGSRLDVPGLSIDDAQAYIDQYFSNTGYAYIA
jgi:5-methylcytosine-specific restriction endonuclease McrA